MKAIFNRDFHWNPPKGVGFFAAESKKPQGFPRAFVEAAVEAGAAVLVKPETTKKEDGE